jgi:hypothetical protein
MYSINVIDGDYPGRRCGDGNFVISIGTASDVYLRVLRPSNTDGNANKTKR